MRNIQIAPFRQKELLRKIFQEYLHELSKYDDSLVLGNNGEFIYDWFDYYFIEKERYPLFLTIDNEIAGFALVRELNFVKYELAEFYICPNYRKNGNGLWFANQIFEMFGGEFNLFTRIENESAVRFWDKISKMYEICKTQIDGNWKSWGISNCKVKRHSLNLAPIYFDLIQKGEKILEGRLNDDKRKSFNIGDCITFYKEPEKAQTLNAVILDKFVFNNFDEMASTLPKEDLGFKDKTKEEMVAVYRTIYSRENEEKNGVVVFKIKTL